MRTKNILVISLAGLLFLSAIILISDFTQAQPMAASSRGAQDLHLIPVGAITFWAGDATTIPNGWQLCDGTNGTPDLRDRFVRGGEVPGETGGSNTVQLTAENLPNHNHDLVIYEAGAHSHKLEDHFLPSVTYYFDQTATYQVSGPPLQGIHHITEHGGQHCHEGYTNPMGSSVPYDNRSAYFKLAFIMRLF